MTHLRRKYGQVAIALTILMTVVATSVQAQEDEDAEDRGRIGTLREGQEQLAREKSEVALRIDLLRADDQAVQDALLDLEEYEQLLTARVAAAEAAIEAAEAEASASEKEAQWLEEKIDGIREQLRNRAIEAFVQPEGDVIDQLASDDLVGSSVKLYLLDQVIGNELDLTDDLRSSEAQLQEARLRALERSGAADRERQIQVEHLDELERARSLTEAFREELRTRIDEWTRVSDELAAADRRIEREIRQIELDIQRRVQERARLEAEAARRAIEEQRRLAEAEGGPFELVVWPVRGPLTSGFGPRVHPIFGNVRPHNGIDIDGDTGDPVSASRSGEVVLAGSRGGFGNTVVLYHGLGYSTLYAHLNSISVTEGDTLNSGDRLGTMGSTGLSTGSHLHFELRIDGAAVDPIPYLP